MGGTGRARPDPAGPVGEVPEDLVERWKQHRDRMLGAARGYAGQATTAATRPSRCGGSASTRVLSHGCSRTVSRRVPPNESLVRTGWV